MCLPRLTIMRQTHFFRAGLHVNLFPTRRSNEDNTVVLHDQRRVRPSPAESVARVPDMGSERAAWTSVSSMAEHQNRDLGVALLRQIRIGHTGHHTVSVRSYGCFRVVVDNIPIITKDIMNDLVII